MTNNQTDWPELCAQLYKALEARSTWDDEALLDRAWVALRRAQSEPKGPTVEDLLAIAAASIKPYEDSGIAIGEYEPETERAVEVYGSELIAFARAVLARWGK